MERAAEFSPCRRYRYVLWRRWGEATDYVMFVGLNPSTADGTKDDPTIRRCIAFAQDWGYSGPCMTNLFAFRAIKPRMMMNAADPVGSENDDWLRYAARQASLIVAAWGVHGTFANRQAIVCKMLPHLHYLRLTKDGYPGHPLYLPKTLQPNTGLHCRISCDRCIRLTSQATDIYQTA
jgi:hypothetical protein